MDKQIRRNELCVIGLPRCDFVFSSTRSCFIGYGFIESALEMELLKHLLTARDIEPIEAGGSLAPAQNAFCAKICSKIITSQFCILLLSNIARQGAEMPSANVNIEYGLALGFNKYVIPFQKEGQELPFNVAGLDTVKYTPQNFSEKAAKAIDDAIAATSQSNVTPLSPDQVLEAFLLSQRLLVVPINTEGDRNLYELGRPLGFNMLMTFDGMQYMYFGNFTALRPEAVVWRIKTLNEIIAARMSSLPDRVKMGLATPIQVSAIQTVLKALRVWALVTSSDQKKTVFEALANESFPFQTNILAMPEMTETLQNIF